MSTVSPLVLAAEAAIAQKAAAIRQDAAHIRSLGVDSLPEAIADLTAACAEALARVQQVQQNADAILMDLLHALAAVQPQRVPDLPTAPVVVEQPAPEPVEVPPAIVERMHGQFERRHAAALDNHFSSQPATVDPVEAAHEAEEQAQASPAWVDDARPLAPEEATLAIGAHPPSTNGRKKRGR